ncbi:hypothetical protein B0H14DRAFT_3523671 [Mycena olivaceomarginata]|nr:hypothetical protein B0H14DRAFT_3523671 [Mycena olivaceomarginata]
MNYGHGKELRRCLYRCAAICGAAAKATHDDERQKEQRQREEGGLRNAEPENYDTRDVVLGHVRGFPRGRVWWVFALFDSSGLAGTTRHDTGYWAHDTGLRLGLEPLAGRERIAAVC